MHETLLGLIQNAVDEANKLANEQGLEHVRILLEEEAPEALEKRVKERREGLRPLDGEPTGVVPVSYTHLTLPTIA